MRVRWVTWWPAPYWRDRFNELSLCHKIELEVVFLSSGTSVHDWHDDAAQWKFNYHILPGKRDSSGYFDVRYRFPNPRALLKDGFDILVMPYADMRCITAALYCMATRKPFALFVPNTRWDSRIDSVLRTGVKRALFRGAPAIFATGLAQRDYAIDQGATTDSIFVIGNPSVHFSARRMDLGSAAETLRKRHGLEHRTIVLYVGRLSAEKSLDTLIRAVSAVENVHLLVVGNGPAEGALKTLASQLRASVTFAGFVQESHLGPYYAIADIFVLPSLSEPWGLVVNEAMHFELPVIVSDRVGSAPMLIRHGHNGLVFQAGDTVGLAEAIRRLAGDSGLRHSMGQAAARTIAEHSVQTWIAAVCRAVESIVGNRAG